MTKTVRVYFPYFPYPPSDGAAHVAFNQIRTLAEMGCSVELVCWKETLESFSAKRAQPYLELFPENVSVRVLAGGAPESAMKRGLRVGASLLISYSSAELFHYPPHLRPKGLEPVDLGIYHYSFAYPWLRMSRAAKANGSTPQEARQVVVFHNLESDLFEGRAKTGDLKLFRKWSSKLEKKIHERNAAKLRAHEGELRELADEIWFISPQDQAQWLQRFGRGETRFIGPGFSPQLRRKRTEKRMERVHTGLTTKGPVLGFVGALNFGPNLQSALWLVEKLAPRLDAYGFQGKLLIVGQGAPPELKRKAFPFPFIHFLGFVPDLEQFWSELDWSLAPHVTGSGVRIKLLESIASGVPTLANRAAVTRIHPNLVHNELLFVSDDPGQWCQQIMDSKRAGFRDKMSEAGTELSFPVELNTQRTLDFLR